MVGFRSFALALTFLTRVPLCIDDVRDGDLGRSLACFPIVGILLAIALTLVERLTLAQLSPELVAVLLVTSLVVLTGGLHVDGLADLFDGLAGSKGDSRRMLAIMRDSRVGSMGAAAVVLCLLAKVFAIAQLERAGASWRFLIFPVAARWAVTPMIVFFPYARSEGLGKSFNAQGSLVHVLSASAVMAAVLAIAGVSSLAATTAAFVTAAGMAVWLRRRLGGLTGDIYGAAIELSELAFLISATVAGAPPP